MSSRSGDGSEWWVERSGFPEPSADQKGKLKMARKKLYQVLKHYGYSAPKGVGKQWIQCPFHGDRHASAGVDWSTNYFTCFACEAKGTALDLVMYKEGVDLNGAAKFVEGLPE